MRTTIDITDGLLRRAKERAAKNGITLRQIVETALAQFLAEPGERSDYQLRWRPQSGELVTGINVNDRRDLYDAIDPPDAIRRRMESS